MAITVPVAGAEITVTDFGAPVVNQLNTNVTDIATINGKITPTAWTNATLLNSWANQAGGGNLQYRKIGDIVYLKGMVSGGANNTVVTTLPVGFRPVVTHDFISYHWPSFPSSCMTTVQASGNLTIQMLDNKTGPPQFVQLNNIFFSTVA